MLIKPDKQWFKTTAQVASVAPLILIAAMIGLGLGYFIDSKLGTKPWLAFVLTVLGLASGIYESVKILMGALKDDGNK